MLKQNSKWNLSHSSGQLVITFIITSLVFVWSVSPRPAVASTNYQPQSIPELIAYLQGVIAALEAQLQAQGRGNQSGGGSQTTNTVVDTLTVASLGSDSVTLQGRINSNYSKDAIVWFEYGSASLTDFSTPRQRLSASSQTFSASVYNLRRHTTYSYRAVVELNNGSRYYGAIGTFRTGETTYYQGDEPSYYGNSSLSLDKTRYSPGENIRFNWSVPSDRYSSTNWVGVYKVGAANTSYTSWQYVSERTGSADFRGPYTEGTYELRLLYNNGYDLIATSRTFTVN